jgi:hypothetical protein
MIRTLKLCFLHTLVIGALALVAWPAFAASGTYNDQGVLANDLAFVQRVRASMISAAINISSDGLSTGINIKRHAQVAAIMNNPDGWKALFAGAICTQGGVLNPATATGTVVLTPMKSTTATDGTVTVTGNADTQQALVTDAAIDASVSGVFNSFFGGQ